MTCTCKRPATWLAAAYPEGHKDKALRKPLCDRCMAWAARLGRELGLLVDVIDLAEVGASFVVDSGDDPDAPVPFTLADPRQLKLFN